MYEAKEDWSWTIPFRTRTSPSPIIRKRASFALGSERMSRTRIVATASQGIWVIFEAFFMIDRSTSSERRRS